MNAPTATLESPVPPELAVLDDPQEQQRFTRWRVGRDGQRKGESVLRLSGMYCAACADTIEQALMAVPGVESARVSASAERARIEWDPARTRMAALVQAIRRAGYDAVPDAAAPARALRQAENRQAVWRLFVAWFCMMQVMMMAWPIYVARPGEMAPDHWQLLNWGSWLLSVPVVWWSAAPFLQGAWRSLRTRRIGMDVPVALGVIVTFVASTGATFDPGGIFGREVYFDSLTMFVSFLLAGRYLEMRARHRVAATLEEALARMPQTANRVGADGSLEAVSVHALRPGDLLQVALGESYPADGELVEGSTQADESLLSGESRPVAKRPGDALVGGALNVGVPVRMRVQRVGADTRYEHIVALMQQALTERPALARAADRWARPFLWVVLVLAIGAAAAWSVIDPSRAVWVAVSVLIVTCPCALSLAAPSALVAAAGGLARRGVLLQRLDALEALARVRRLFIDKTGTLTEDSLALRELQPAPTLAVADVQPLRERAAALARWSTHPLSRALVQAVSAACNAGAVVEAGWTQVREQPGQGMSALDAQGVEWRLGRASWVADASVEEGGDALQVAFGRRGQVLLTFGFEERLREDAAAAMAALRAAGIEPALLSGDAPGRVQRVAQRLSLPVAMAGATPEAKLQAVRQAQAVGDVVAMVGDGVNDAPVLAQADVSFAMGEGALVARVHADAILPSQRLQALADARSIAARSMRIVRQNIAWAALYNAACIPLALAGWLPPWAAGLGMAASSLLVVGNSLRLAR
ncbi:heavy metal translocating P-type ATPase [Azohydromonas caseinilytica]|uniref:Cadmium-translocating P-type ATPase n=1 Tax=Azohydromonas caseinilytica TaxID=2728836 RepID=A0A848F7A9_9BURK|nr:cation-translocating P-type ATPase [Azohydromonas caseinilytica]NML15464.1 cadmium-translocating P-type ATPase [Azohydromonas caseinilytica]